MNIKTTLILAGILFLLLTLASCGEDIQLPNKILQGEIDGNEWTFGTGKGSANQSARTYRVELFNFTGFSETEGCLLFGGSNPYISAVIPFDTADGSQIDAFSAPLIFHIDGVNTLTADRGFIEISFINNTEIRGFISAGSSNENFAEGFFSVFICN